MANNTMTRNLGSVSIKIVVNRDTAGYSYQVWRKVEGQGLLYLCSGWSAGMKLDALQQATAHAQATLGSLGA